jgi:hypothetical protein
MQVHARVSQLSLISGSPLYELLEMQDFSFQLIAQSLELLFRCEQTGDFLLAYKA